MPIYKTEEKKDGLYKYLVRLNYTDKNGAHRQLTRSAWGKAEAAELEAKLKRETNLVIPSTSITVKQLSDKMLEAKKPEVRESTLDKSLRNLNRYILPYLGECRLNKLNSQIFTDWKLTIETHDLSLTTKRNIYSELRTLLNFAVKLDYLLVNPLLKVGNFKSSYEEEKEMMFYTPEEFKKYISEAKKEADDTGYYDYFVFFCVAYYTGARKGEINALRWTDYDGKEIHIHRSICQKLKGADRETPPKNKSSIRDVQVPLPLKTVLDEHKERCCQYKGFSESFHICGGAVCLRDTSVDKTNRKFAKAAGVKHIRIHDFRHSHASLLINNNINVLEVSRRLGHAKVEETLNTYSHFFPKEKEKALKVLNSIKF
ncbi:MAG: site-specific integrase [Ruminococcaceae bacterium]|nr:site-specific integrase [Oscillospiraceae bacterium]